MSNPGLILAHSRIKPTPAVPFTLTEPTFLKWYQTEHIPDVFVAGQTVRASQWKSLSSTDEFPYLTIYELPDLGVTATDSFKAIPTKSQRFLGGYDLTELIDLDVVLVRGSLAEVGSVGKGGKKGTWLAVVHGVGIGDGEVDLGAEVTRRRAFELMPKDAEAGRPSSSVSCLEFEEEPRDLEGKGKGGLVRRYQLLADLTPE